jgi:hypothetical protein
MRDPSLSPEAVQLQRQLLHDVDGLAQATENKKIVDMAFLLRGWVSSKVSYPQRELLIDHGAHSVPEILSMMEEGKGGLWCGGVALVMTYVLNAFQIPACVYGYGYGDVSHATTIFGKTIGYGRTYSFYILDAYLSFHYVHARTNELLSLADVFHLVKTKQYDQIERIDERIERELVTSDRDAAYYDWLFDKGAPEMPTRIASEHKVYAGATHNVDKLVSTGPFREAIDKVRGKQGMDEFLMDLMLVRPTFSPLVSVPEAYPELTLLRSVIESLLEEPTWTK